jgi:Gpi18-like mannosyltransferase
MGHGYLFSVDKTTQLNEFKIKCQEDKLHVTCFLMWRPFEVKLSLLHKHIDDHNLNHFPSYKVVFESSISTGEWKTLKKKFAGITQQLQNKFLSQFIDFHTGTKKSEDSKTPFAFDTYQVPMHMSMEVTKL